MKINRLKKLHEDFPNPPERAFCERVLGLLEDFQMPMELAWGLAIMRLLDLCEVELKSGEFLEESSAYVPNLLSMGSLAAYLFHEVSENSYWWREKYNAGLLEAETNQAFRRLVDKLKTTGAVTSIRGA